MENLTPLIIAHAQPNLVAGRWTVDAEEMVCTLKTTPILGWVMEDGPYGYGGLEPLLISGQESFVERETWDEGKCESRYSDTGWLLLDMNRREVMIDGEWEPINEYEKSMLRRFKKVRAAQVQARKATRRPPAS